MPNEPRVSTDLASLGIVTVADLLAHLGDVPPERVRFRPIPGKATAQDVLDIDAHEDRFCELVDGVLVEKATGLLKGLVATQLSERLVNFVTPRRLGLVTGEGGMMRLLTTQVRIPDVAFLSWDRLPGRRVPSEQIPAVVPDLAVYVISPGNAAAEMAFRRREYFEAGTRLVWMIDPRDRSAVVYVGPEQATTLNDADDVLGGGDVLPGFELPVRELFALLDEYGERVSP